MNECGLDPGIDHMSAVELIHRIKNDGGEIQSFKSYTGGLIAPECSNNPWGYKFTWNPRNVILAGQSTAQYLEHGTTHFIPYRRLFRQVEKVEVPNVGVFDGYANRDSLTYINHYELQGVKTLLRGTLRNRGFCSAWDIFVTLGITDDSFKIADSHRMTYAQFIRSFLPINYNSHSLKEAIAELCGISRDGDLMSAIAWTGILDDTKIPLKNASPASILQDLLEKKWLLDPSDKDMIVMTHEFVYEIGGNTRKITSSLMVKGTDSNHTAMSKTVGLPLGIAVKLYLTGKLNVKGVVIPVEPEVYIPVLEELKKEGIAFSETESTPD